MLCRYISISRNEGSTWGLKGVHLSRTAAGLAWLVFGKYRHVMSPASVHVYQRVRIFLDVWGFLEISFLRWFLGNVERGFSRNFLSWEILVNTRQNCFIS